MLYVQNGKFIAINPYPRKHSEAPDPDTYPEIVQYAVSVTPDYDVFIAVGIDGSVWMIIKSKAIKVLDVYDIRSVTSSGHNGDGNHIVSAITKCGHVLNMYVDESSGVQNKKFHKHPENVTHTEYEIVLGSDGVIHGLNHDNGVYHPIDMEYKIKKISGQYPSLLLLEDRQLRICSRIFTEGQVIHIDHLKILTETGDLYDFVFDLVMSGIPNPDRILQIYVMFSHCSILYKDHTLVIYELTDDPKIWSEVCTVPDIDCIPGIIDRQVQCKSARNSG